MPYATRDEMIARFGEEELILLTDRDGAGAIDDVPLARALDDADGDIDGYLAPRYALPLASVPPVLSRLACELARYYLYDDHATETVRTRYEDARDVLIAISKGTVQLGLPESAGTVEEVALPQFQSGRREFGGGGF